MNESISPFTPDGRNMYAFRNVLQRTQWKHFRNTHLREIQTSCVFLVHVSLGGLGPDGGGACYPNVWDVMLCYVD